MLCPECFGDTKSENKGIIRHRVCRSCGHKFSTIEVLYEPEMHTREKLEKFMRERKRPTTTAVLAAYFMVSSGTINKLMGQMENAGKVTRTKLSGGKNQWSWNHKLALPQPPAPVQPRREPAPIVGSPIKEKSYAHIRGYDD